MFGLTEARYVQNKIKELGIKDIELYFDNTILPDGMWCVCQVNKPSGTILLFRDTKIDTQPQLMWWIKNSRTGRPRLPSDQDISDIVITVKRAHVIWDKGGDWLANELDKQSQAKDQKHQKNFRQKIKDIAPEMKKAIRKEAL